MKPVYYSDDRSTRLRPDCRRLVEVADSIWTSQVLLLFFFFSLMGRDGACRVLLRHTGAKIGSSVKEQAKTCEDPWVPLGCWEAQALEYDSEGHTLETKSRRCPTERTSMSGQRRVRSLPQCCG